MLDRERIEAFLGRFVELAAGTTTIGLLAVADRTGLLAHLGTVEAGTAASIATEARLNERYVIEILSGLAAAGVVEYDPASGIFTLPPEQALFLADDSSPYFMGGWMDMLPAVMSQIDGVATATVHGGGVGFEDFGRTLIRGVDRGNAPSQRVFLTNKWLAAVPGLVERLEDGIRVADVGSGSGRAAILMAEAFPSSEVVGFDISEDSVAVARSRSEEIANVDFHNYGVEELPLDPGFDLITTFDVVHDLTNPLAGLQRIREALRPNGSYLMMEPNASSKLEENLTDRGSLLYGISALHCMTQSLANGGAGLGAAWGTQQAEDLANQAGFESFEKLDAITNKFSAFYLLSG